MQKIIASTPHLGAFRNSFHENSSLAKNPQKLKQKTPGYNPHCVGFLPHNTQLYRFDG